MGAAITSLLILSVLFASVFMIYQTKLHGAEVVDGAVRQTALLDHRRAVTSISMEGADAFSLSRCDTIVQTEIKNVGDTPIEHIENMDVFTWYTTDTGEPVITPFQDTNGNLLKDEWAVTGVGQAVFDGVWDPGETLSFSWRFLRPPQQGTSGYITVVTPNGVSDSAYVDFVQVTSADCRFLHNYPTPPTGDTASQPLLPMEGGLPSAVTLFNYDANRDGEPGLTLLRSQNGLAESVTTKYQVWRTGVLGAPKVISGDVLIDLFAALTPVTQGQVGIVVAYLRDFDGSSHTEIGSGAVFARDWQSGATGFVERMALVKDVDYTIPAGHELEVRLQIDIASQQDMTLAYDTEQHSSLVNLFFVPPATSTFHYLHNNPTPPVGDTSRQAVLPLGETAPAGSVLYRYGQPGNNPGLLLRGTELGLAETIPDKYQAWRTIPLAQALTIQGDVLVDIWAGIKNFQVNQSGAMTVYLRDYDGSSYTEIANGSIFAEDWQQGSGTFVPQTIIIPDLNYTVPAGHQLEARIIADTIKASKDMWLAYDTSGYPSVIRLP